MKVLVFCPKTENQNTHRLLEIVRDSLPGGAPVHVELVDEDSPPFSAGKEDYAAVVLLYTPAAELSGRLFELVRYIDRQRPVGRFLFLPRSAGQEAIPPIFHSIRMLQMKLFYYDPCPEPPQELEAALAAFGKAWQDFCAPGPAQGQSAQGTKRRGSLGLFVTVSAVILLLVGVITVLARNGVRNLIEHFRTPTPTLVQPPSAGIAWLGEPFHDLDQTLWQVQHAYTGKQGLQENFSSGGLQLSAAAPVEQAELVLASTHSWALDAWQSESFTFAVSSLPAGQAASTLEFGLHLEENPDYLVSCQIVPKASQADVQCLVQSPARKDALSDVLPVSLDEQHTAMLVFDPQNYRLQFFLDGRLRGQTDIQGVEYWRGRSFQVDLKERLEGLQSGTFGCTWYELRVTGQP